MKIKILLFVFYILFILSSNLLSSEDNKSLKVGLLVPLSGPYSEIGNSLLYSLQLALEEINDKEVSIIPRDSGFNDKEKIAIEWAEAVTLNKALNDGPLWDKVRSNFSDVEIVEITLASSMFNMINRLNDTFRSELETTDFNKKQWDATGKLPLQVQEAFAGRFSDQRFAKK